MPTFKDKKGVLVILPHNSEIPATITIPVTPAMAGKSIRSSARNSDALPGGTLTFKHQVSFLRSFPIQKEWVTVGARIPPEARKIDLEWHADGWFLEMLWIDWIEVGTD
jgi:hypothetical protein